MTLTDALIRFFGITNNPKECGYILPDGRMLDFSGRHILGKCSGGKWVEHHDFTGTNLQDFSLEDLYEMYPVLVEKYHVPHVMDCCHLIKFQYDARIVATVKLPTDAQYRTVLSAFGERDCVVSMTDADGYLIDDAIVKCEERTMRKWFETTIKKKPTSNRMITLERVYGCKGKLYTQYELYKDCK